MNLSGKHGFALPLALMLSNAILILATILLKHSQFEFEQKAIQTAHFRCRQMLVNQVDPILAHLNKEIIESLATTFLQDVGGGPYRTGIYKTDGTTAEFPGSTDPGSRFGKVVFLSPVSDISLLADWINLSPENASPIQIAWAIEDIPLAATDNEALPWWPLPQWQLGPVQPMQSMGDAFAHMSGRELGEITVIPANDPIPFNPTMAPAFVPVVYHVGLRFGLFASGNVGQREKVLRMRYYLDCGIWNPYNRPMHFHDRSRPDPVFQMVFWNLPRIKINNISKGVSTGWMEMDELINPQTGATGIHGWIRLKGILDPGESVNVEEPDPKSQPEGLARLVHPAFLIGPADEVHIQFQPNENGISVACLPMGGNLPVNDAMGGHGWYRIEDFPIDTQDMEFARADDPQHPFYLAAGSLAFRKENAQFQIAASRTLEHTLLKCDPRRIILDASQEFLSGTGEFMKTSELLDVSFKNLREQGVKDVPQFTCPALFSWPSVVPQSLLDLTDLPDWENAFLLGMKGAEIPNYSLDQYWPLPQMHQFTWTNYSGESLSFQRTIHVNAIAANAWHAFLKGPPSKDEPIRFARYPSPINESDFLEVPSSALKGIAGRIASRIKSEPVHSISEFFNTGILSDAMRSLMENPLHQLLPLRGLQTKRARMVTRGSSMILHIACLSKQDDVNIVKTARVWLMEMPHGGKLTHMRKIHFEWTEPSSHLTFLN